MLLISAVSVGLPLSRTESLSAATPQELVDQAIGFYNDGDYPKAVQFLEEAVKLDPRYARAHLWLGVCDLKLGNADGATTEFQQVIVLAPNSEDAQRARQYLATVKPLGPPTFLADMQVVTGVAAGNLTPATLFAVQYRKAIWGGCAYGGVPIYSASPIDEDLRDRYRRWGFSGEWRVVYNLQGRYARFRALAGLADKSEPSVGAVFVVRGDGRVLFASDFMQVGAKPMSLDIDVTGLSQFELVSLIQCFGAAVVWADPAVYPVR